jgi:hypothetical protein
MAVTRMQIHLWAANRRPQTELPLPMTTIRFTTEARTPRDNTPTQVGFDSMTSEESRLGSVV